VIVALYWYSPVWVLEKGGPKKRLTTYTIHWDWLHFAYSLYKQPRYSIQIDWRVRERIMLEIMVRRKWVVHSCDQRDYAHDSQVLPRVIPRAVEVDFWVRLRLRLKLRLNWKISRRFEFPRKRRPIGKISSFSDSAHWVWPDSPFPASLTEKFFIMPLWWDVPKEKIWAQFRSKRRFLPSPTSDSKNSHTFGFSASRRVDWWRNFLKISKFQKIHLFHRGLNSHENDVEFEKCAHVRIHRDETRRLVKESYENFKNLENAFLSIRIWIPAKTTPDSKNSRILGFSATRRVDWWRNFLKISKN
jgi:hypothetical protein